MGDICIDYCESTDCKNCSYRKASKEDKEKAYEHLIKTFMCPLRCNVIEIDCEGINCRRYKDHCQGYNDCKENYGL